MKHPHKFKTGSRIYASHIVPVRQGQLSSSASGRRDFVFNNQISHMVNEVGEGGRPPRTRVMDPRMWHRVAAISGIAALGLGTYGFHIFKPQNPVYKDVWQTASLYHLIHTTALLASPVTKYPHVFGGLLTAGILTFSGSCYTAAWFEDKGYSTLAPLGGFAFVAAWASLLF